MQYQVPIRVRDGDPTKYQHPITFLGVSRNEVPSIQKVLPHHFSHSWPGPHNATSFVFINKHSTSLSFPNESQCVLPLRLFYGVRKIYFDGTIRGIWVPEATIV